MLLLLGWVQFYEKIMLSCHLRIEKNVYSSPPNFLNSRFHFIKINYLPLINNEKMVSFLS